MQSRSTNFKSTNRQTNVPFWSQPALDVAQNLKTNPKKGLAAQTADQRLENHPQQTYKTRFSTEKLLIRQFATPISLILIVATILSMVLGDILNGAIILAIILASGLMSFFQEYRANQTVKSLLDKVQVSVSVLRDGREQQIPVSAVVPGDILILRTGDVIPADARLFETGELLVNESTLTGESFPSEKNVDILAKADVPISQRLNSVFKGTYVVSGNGRAIAVSTGQDTEFGHVTQALRQDNTTTAFQKGTTKFGYMLVRIMLMLTVLIFIFNTLLQRPVVDSLLFSLALAVGLTPQMLPTIVTISLSVGARAMARKKAIVKKLSAIENFGTMTTLCTDKTGTLTVGAAQLDHAYNASGQPDDAVIKYGAINAGLQTSFKNPIDEAILKRRPQPRGFRLIDEVPYDFERKRLSVLVQQPEPTDKPQLITKGSLEAVLAICSSAIIDDHRQSISDIKPKLMQQFQNLSAQGFRVIGLAIKDLNTTQATRQDETDMQFIGMLVFHDPIKPGIKSELRKLQKSGISIRLVTGDNRLAANMIASQVGLDTENILTGPQIDDLNDTKLIQAIQDVTVFAEVDPIHKQRIVMALRQNGECVGFMGDGINDSPALHAADVSISVNTAVDVAKEAANIILLNNSLSVVQAGVMLGRRTFANTLKYVRVTTSANFGNMISMSIASLFLPFLPLLPLQILILNFLTDFPSTTIAGDNVDRDQLAKPNAWDMPGVKRFMIAFGLLSAVFDLITFAVLLLVFHTDATSFRSAWFIESVLTELAVLFVLRTSQTFFRSRPSRPLIISSLAVAALVILAPFALPQLASIFGFVTLSPTLMVAVGVITAIYVILNEWLKRRFFPVAAKPTKITD